MYWDNGHFDSDVVVEIVVASRDNTHWRICHVLGSLIGGAKTDSLVNGAPLSTKLPNT